MDRLSSCYFCGAALDASLSEYPVVPKRLQTAETPDQRVTLCPTCRRKLATVIEDVVAAAETTVGGDETEAEADTETVGAAGTSDDTPEDTDAALVRDTESDAAAGSDGGTSETADRPHPMATAGSGDGEETAETSDTGSGSGHDTADADDAGADTAGADDEGPSLSRLEYSKVMRLLQNRQLPVDRAEIRTVAVNAYDIDPEEFDAVIDAAVERGLIGEEDGQFVAAE